ncbi:hypothetical protein HHL22_00565 [Hymenobacter sp. RP-2-7]|uniref:Lipoprotein n=1 Tax=Hymenobacter polaris TaxID=2682546 RepID=A0A7Y0AAE0_9BACT|nr:hypothetical protein [Hymenobacter polaris]NML63693.1 hypothetical protein [Hymenobacter polaris]
MKRFRLLLAGTVGLLTLGLGSCLKAPNYPVTPEISVDDTSVVLRHYASGGTQPIDSVFITIRFQDGDGDLGLSSAESAVSPYAYPSRFNNNYFIEPYIKQPNGTFVPLTSLMPARTVAGAYNSRFEHIATTSENHSAPIKGTLTRVYAFAYQSLYRPGEEARFQISIADRALHESNTVITNSVVFPK